MSWYKRAPTEKGVVSNDWGSLKGFIAIKSTLSFPFIGFCLASSLKASQMNHPCSTRGLLPVFLHCTVHPLVH